jgi:hypothetical protein
LQTIILPFVFYGSETWSLALRVEPRLRVSESRVQQIVSVKTEVTGGRRNLNNEELHNFSLNGVVIVTKLCKKK